MKKVECCKALAVLALGLASTQAGASDTLVDFLKQSTFSGNVRAYDFNRIYSHNTQSAQPSQSAFSVGGRFDALSAPFLGGFAVGVGFMTAHSLGLNNSNDNFAHLDSTLAGTRTSITALGQAYLQYKNPWLLVKVGDQTFNTPWINESDSRLLPATYQGIYADVTPISHVHLIGLRLTRWKSRTSNDYFQNNLYYAATYGGDDLRGGTGTKLTTADTQGALAFGATYADHGLKVGLWYYNYEQFASTIYNDTVYTLKTGTGFDPFIGDQFLRQWKGDSLLNGQPVNTVKGSGVDNLTYGAKAGLDSPYGQLMFSYTAISDHPGTVGNGALISPYTIGYTTDPLDTSSMIRGMVDTGPGHAWKVKYSEKLLNKQLVLVAAFARYYSYAYGNSNNAYFDIAYYPGGRFKGFSVRNRFEDAITESSSKGLNPGKSNYFIYNRVQIQYEF
ncbi:MAG: outer membrane porin, OprD family [Nevskia sp.]|nr:outer membrane porin, OprD family [Nevskia sp.]